MEQPTVMRLSIIITTLLVSAVTVDAAAVDVERQAVVHYQIPDDDVGYFTNCGTVPFNASWSPKILSGYKSASVTIDWTAPHDLTSGFFSAAVWVYGDPNPIVNYTTNFKCDKLAKLQMPCPLSQGYSYHATSPLPKTEVLQNFPGRFLVKLAVENQDHQEMLCAEADVTVKND